MQCKTRFKNIKQINEVTASTYRQACLLLGLIADDNHLHHALSGANQSSSPEQLRNLFAVILTACEPADPSILWERHKDNMSEDLFLPYRNVSLSDEQIAHTYNACLLKGRQKTD